MSDAARASLPVQRQNIQAGERLIVALDFETVEEAHRTVDRLGDTVSFYKIGLQLQLAPKLRQLFERLVAENKKIFLDFKYMDIPSTIEGVVKSASALQIKFMTVIGQRHIVQAAMKGKGNSDLKILAVTLLTHMNEMDMRKEYSTTCSLRQFVEERSKDLIDIGCDGLITSPNEIKLIRDTLPNRSFLIVTPGIRPLGTSRDDQKRVATPYDAIMNGADYLVVGRPITRSADAEGVTQRIIDEMKWAFETREGLSRPAPLPVAAEIY
jgi:orotidine-5'-phosphate decarboxylase